MRRALPLALLLLSAGWIGCDTLEDDSIPGEVIVGMVPDAREADLRAYADPRGLHVLSYYVPEALPMPPFALVRVPVGREDRWVRRLQRQPFVRYAERNQRVYPRLSPMP